jgi:hypothetical protein
MRMDRALALLCQFLTTRSIVGVAIRQLKCLTGQAQSPVGEANEARRLAAVLSRSVFPAASPQSLVATWLFWPIVIWYGEELTE